MTQPIEILVHVSGPSRGGDDARYRKEARSFLDFEPALRHDLLEDEGGRVGVDDEEESLISIEEPHALRGHGKDYDGDRYFPVDQGRRHVGQTVCRLGKRGLVRDEGVEEDRRQDEQRNGEGQPDTSRLSRIQKSMENIREMLHTPLTQGPNDGGVSGEKLSKIQEGFLKRSHIRRTPLRPNNITPSNLAQASHSPAVTYKTPQLSKSNPSPFIILSSVKETPHVLIARTPAQPAPGGAPTEQCNTNKQPPKLRRTQSDSWETPPSTIPDSQPNVRPLELAEISSSPCLKRPFLSSSPSPTRNRSPSAKRPRLQVPSSPPMAQESSSPVVVEPVSEGSQPPPVKFSRSPSRLSPQELSSPSAKRPQLQGPSSPPTGQESSSSSSFPQSEEPAIESLPSPPSPDVPPPPPPSPPINEPSTVPPQPAISPAPTDDTSSFFPILPPYPSPPHPHPNYYCLTLCGPRPTVSKSRFVTHINPAMTRMKTQLPLTRGYDPFTLYQTRRLHTLERGYWHIPLTTWSPELIIEFWDFLKIQIESGKAGFCTCAGRVLFDEFGEEMWGGGGGKGRPKDEVCKVWCWGEIVGEVWLFLFVGSKKATRGCGAKWVDAFGEAVVVMK